MLRCAFWVDYCGFLAFFGVVLLRLLYTLIIFFTCGRKMNRDGAVFWTVALLSIGFKGEFGVLEPVLWRRSRFCTAGEDWKMFVKVFARFNV